MDIYIIHNGNHEGPYSVNAITELLKHGILSNDDYAWYQGLEDWIFVKDLQKQNIPQGSDVTDEIESDGQAYPIPPSTDERMNNAGTNLITDESQEPAIRLPIASAETSKRTIQINSDLGLKTLQRWGLKDIQTGGSFHGKYSCPHCGSDSVQRVSALCTEGTSTYSGGSSGIAVVGIGTDQLSPVIGRGSSYGKIKSELAERFAPPPDPARGSSLRFKLISLFFGEFIIGMLVLAALSPHSDSIGATAIMILAFMIMAFIIFASWFSEQDKLNRVSYSNYSKEYTALKNHWDNSWYCHKCGYFGLL
jgi:ribosomal protein L37AE/L43A